MKNGFTLIELLIVITVMGILAGVILVGTSSLKPKAQQAKFKSYVSGIKASIATACGGEYTIVDIDAATANFTPDINLVTIDPDQLLSYDCSLDSGITVIPAITLGVPASCTSAIVRMSNVDYSLCQ